MSVKEVQTDTAMSRRVTGGMSDSEMGKGGESMSKQMKPDSEGAWICKKHELERGHDNYGSHCFRCLKEIHAQLQAELDKVKGENEHLCNTIEATRQELADMLAGTLECKLKAGLETVREQVEDLKRAELGKNNCIHMLAHGVADLWHAVADGKYDARSFVGDTILPMQEVLLEIGIDVREKPLNSEALKGK